MEPQQPTPLPPAPPSVKKEKPKRNTKIYPPRKLKVLIAEDNVINQKVLDRILKRVGVTDITIVDNGKKAVDSSAINHYDCILMDMQMPIMDGLEATKQIVKRDGKENANIVFVTAHALVEFKAKALKAGGIDFVTKPFKMEDIHILLTKLEEKLLQEQQQKKKKNVEKNNKNKNNLLSKSQEELSTTTATTSTTNTGDDKFPIVTESTITLKSFDRNCPRQIQRDNDNNLRSSNLRNDLRRELK